MNSTTLKAGELHEQTANATLTERASESCRLAKQFEKAGDFEKAARALSGFWPDRQAPPEINSLTGLAKADVLLRIGVLAGWLGSTHQIEGGQETAKNLITQSIELFASLGESQLVAEAQSDLALCYWREGSFDEARVTISDAMQRVSDDNRDLKALLLIRAGIIAVQLQRLHEALRLYNEASTLLEKSEDHTLKGAFHNEYGMVFRRLAAPENREDYLDRALMEYTAASFHFEQAGNKRYLALVENNLGFLLYTIGHYKDAHAHLNRARQLLVELKDLRGVAEIDDTRARTLLAEGRFADAERVVRSAVRTLERGDEHGVFVDALITEAIALARLGNYARSRSLLDRAIQVAERAGDASGAARARLTIIEELAQQNSAEDLKALYKSAAGVLSRSQDPALSSRLIDCAGLLIDALESYAEPLADQRDEVPEGWKDFSLKSALRSYEGVIIARALRDAQGSVTRAAKLLGFRHHQSLISLINTRHKALIKSRSAIRQRRQHLFSKPRHVRGFRANSRPLTAPNYISILYVEDDQSTAISVGEMLAREEWRMEHCLDSDTALRQLTDTIYYDAVVVDSELGGVDGAELVSRTRKMTHRRRTPIVMLSDKNQEAEAFRVGADAYLKKPDQIEQLPLTIARLLKVKLRSQASQ